MAKICEVCGESTNFLNEERIDGIVMHNYCINTFEKDPVKYGDKPIEKTENLTKNEKEAVEQREQKRNEQQHRIEEKSVYVKGFSMPFGEMVEFMVKWAIASIPAFIILFIIFGILFAVFGALFF